MYAEELSSAEHTMVMNVFAGNNGRFGLSDTLAAFNARIAELGTLLLETSPNGTLVTMSMVSLLNTTHPVRVLLGQYFAMLDGLDRCVMMVLMDLLINGYLALLDASLVDCFLCDGRGHTFMDGRVMMTSLGPESTDARSARPAR